MMTRQDLGPPVVGAPQPAGASPHARVRRTASRAATCVALAGLAGVFACESAEDAQVSAPAVVAIGASEAPSYSDANLTLYESQTPVPFPVRKPTAADMAGLTGTDAPYPHPPFLLDSNETIEVNFTLTNLDNQSHAIAVLIDPWNEFVRYKPGVTVVSDDETEPNLSGWDQFFAVPAMSRVTGTLTSDDMLNLATQLATCENILSMPLDPTDPDAAGNQTMLCNRAFNIQNRSNDGDPLLTPLMPKVIAGLTGFDLGLRTYEPANVAIEISVNIVDNVGNLILPPGTATSQLIALPPTVLSPANARE